jgi:hypothetical protein
MSVIPALLLLLKKGNKGVKKPMIKPESELGTLFFFHPKMK